MVLKVLRTCQSNPPALNDQCRSRRAQRCGFGDTADSSGLAYLLTEAAWASKPGPGLPRSMGRDGSTACVKASQAEHAKRGRTMRFTMKRPGTYSSSSVTILAKTPQAAASTGRNHRRPAVSSTSMRGTVIRDRATLSVCLWVLRREDAALLSSRQLRSQLVSSAS